MAKNTDKCYTKKDKLGVSYTTCVGKGGKQLRGTKTKDTKQYKKVLKATKKVEKEEKDKDIKSYKNVLKATKKFEKDQDKSDIMMYKKMMKKMKEPKVIRNVSETMSAQNSSSSYGRTGKTPRLSLQEANELHKSGELRRPTPTTNSNYERDKKFLEEKSKIRMSDGSTMNEWYQRWEERKEKEKRLKIRRELHPHTATGNDQWDSLTDMEQQDLLIELMR
tara:strand:+ start:222 stop:884 length:663 start_codon:yes stop_codon:yes gene_type:complete